MAGVLSDHFSETHLMLAGQSLNPDHELTLFILDALQFVSAFIILISQCAPNVYLSALPFAPEQSHVAKKFCPRVPNLLAITQGKFSQWSMMAFTARNHKDNVMHMVFSLDESTFASISGPFHEIMYVCDSETGYCISGPFKLPSYGFVNDARFSPDGKHILVKFATHAVVWDIEMGEEQFQIQGVNYAFIHQGRRIASTHWIEEDGRSFQLTDLENFEESMVSGSSEDKGVSDGSEDEGTLDDFEDENALYDFEDHILVRVWDASNGTLISNRLLEVNGVAVTRFSPDERFLAVGRKSENVIELWNLEDVRDPQRFAYPHGKLSFIRFFSN